MKITINNEEVLCNKDFTINEEMLNTSSVILNNVYPVEWEQDKDYVSRFYYPKDYSKCKIFDEIEHPATREDAEGTSFSINIDTSKEYEIQTLKGQTSQSGTPTPDSPVPINITTGRQVVSVVGKNFLPNNQTTQTINGITFTMNTDKSVSISGTATATTDYYFVGGASQYIDLGLPNGNYNLNGVEGGSLATYMLYCVQNRNGSLYYYQSVGNTGVVINVQSGDKFRFFIRVLANATPNTTIYPQLEKGTTATTYEEYKGNDYEINLGKNLFYINDFTTTQNGGTVSVSNGNTISITGTFSAGTNISFDSYVDFSSANSQLGNVMTLSVQNIVNEGTTSITPNRLFLGSVDTLLYMQPNQTTGIITKTITEAFNRCRLYVPPGTYDTTINVQLEKGSQATSYSPYKTPIYLGKIGTYQDYINKSTGKNLLKFDNTNNPSRSLYTYTTEREDLIVCTKNTTGNDFYAQFITYLESGKTYTLSVDDDTKRNIYMYSDRLWGTGISGLTNKNAKKETPFTFTSSYTGKAVIGFFGGGSQTLTNPMLNEGSTALPYEPYGTGQWYIHKEIGRVVLNGSENLETTSQTSIFLLRNINSSNYLGYSNYYKSVNQNIAWQSMSNYSIYLRSDQNQLLIRNNDITTLANFKTWLQSHNTSVYYVLNTPTNTLIEDEELINQLNAIELLDGLNNVSVSSADLPFIMSLMYNYQEGYTEEELYFCGIVKNTGEISLNPRHPHYCNIQVLDFKDFLSQGETLDFVITEKTIGEAIDQVIGTIAPYGFIKGNILLDDVDELMGTYSTKDKTAYDVFNYIADITQSRWTTRMVDENTIAIDYFDPNKLPLGEQIEYNQTWFRNHKIDDLSYSYSSNDYRNKQVMLSGEVYSNIETTEILVADGYQTQFNTIDKIGKVSSLLLNGTPVSIITKEEYDLGYDADFYYQPGNKYFESVNLVSTGAILTIVYYAIIEGREIILNQEEISLIEERTGRKGVIARYENRNDATTTGELQAIGQSYLEYKGIPEIKLNVSSRENTWNIGDRVYFNAPLDELKQTYMVKAKKVQRITTIDELFYQYELTSSFNMEQDINYFDNQRYKSRGNIGEGEFISRNIDIENTANVIFYDLEVQEVEVEGNSTLQSELQSVLGGVE